MIAHEENILPSGWLIGDRYMSRKVALIDARLEKWKVVLYRFRTHFRYHTHSTFKFFLTSSSDNILCGLKSNPLFLSENFPFHKLILSK